MVNTHIINKITSTGIIDIHTQFSSMNHHQITKHAVYRGNSSHNTSVKILYFRLISRITNYVFIIVNYPLNVILPTRQTQKRSSNASSINTGSRWSESPRVWSSIFSPDHTSLLLDSLLEKTATEQCWLLLDLSLRPTALSANKPNDIPHTLLAFFH